MAAATAAPRGIDHSTADRPTAQAAASPLSAESATRFAPASTGNSDLEAEVCPAVSVREREAAELPLPAVTGSARKPVRERAPIVAVVMFLAVALLLIGAYLFIQEIFEDQANKKHAGSNAPAGTEDTSSPAVQAAGTGAAYDLPPPEAEGEGAGSGVGDEAAPPSENSTAAATAGTAIGANGNSTCYEFYASLAVHPDQVYAGNPDSSARGYAQVSLCTDGTARSSSVLFYGHSRLVASHIHLAGAAGADPPVLSFCGGGARGLLDDPTPYPRPCNQWDSQKAASNMDVPGVYAGAPDDANMTVAERVADIAARPQAYYFNFHTLASATHWYPHSRGISRGPLELVGTA